MCFYTSWQSTLAVCRCVHVWMAWMVWDYFHPLQLAFSIFLWCHSIVYCEPVCADMRQWVVCRVIECVVSGDKKNVVRVCVCVCVRVCACVCVCVCVLVWGYFCSFSIIAKMVACLTSVYMTLPTMQELMSAISSSIPPSVEKAIRSLCKQLDLCTLLVP